MLFHYVKIERNSFHFRHLGKGNIQSIFSELIRYGFPLYLATFTGIITLNIDKIIVSNFENLEKFAVFSAGAMEIPIFGMIVSSITQPIFPKYVEYFNSGKEEEAKKLWIKLTKNISYITYPIILVLIILSDNIITFIYGDKYKEATIFFVTYLLIGLFRNNHYGALLLSKGKTNWILFYGFLTMSLNIALSILLYEFFGILGVIYGTLLSVMLVAFAQLFHEQLLKEFFRNVLLDHRIMLFLFIVLILYFGRF